MTVIDLTASESYKELYSRKTYPNHSTRNKLLVFSELNSKEVVDSLVQASTSTDSPEFYMYMLSGERIPCILHRPMIKQSTMGETIGDWDASFYNKLYLLEGYVGWGGECPLARKVSEPAFT